MRSELDRPRHHKISAKVHAALDALVHGARSITDAAQAAGMRREALSRALQKSHVQEELDRRVRDALRRRGVKALATIENLSDGARSEYVRLEASKDLANRAGYIPPKEPLVADNVLIVNIRIDDNTPPVVLQANEPYDTERDGLCLERNVSR